MAEKRHICNKVLRNSHPSDAEKWYQRGILENFYIPIDIYTYKHTARCQYPLWKHKESVDEQWTMEILTFRMHHHQFSFGFWGVLAALYNIHFTKVTSCRAQSLHPCIINHERCLVVKWQRVKLALNTSPNVWVNIFLKLLLTWTSYWMLVATHPIYTCKEIKP